MKKLWKSLILFIKPKIICVAKWLWSAIKIIAKIAIKIIALAAFLGFSIVPFLHNFIDIRWA